MRLLRLACLALAVHSSRALRLVPTEGRRAALGRGVAAAAASAAAASAAATAALRPAAALASTAAELTGVQAGFDEAAEKRARYQAMQKDYKKAAWRKQLSNLEFSDSDGEALEAIKAIIKLIREHGERDSAQRDPAGRPQAGPRPGLQARAAKPFQTGADGVPRSRRPRPKGRHRQGLARGRVIRVRRTRPPRYMKSRSLPLLTLARLFGLRARGMSMRCPPFVFLRPRFREGMIRYRT
ncbi:hypothetical protein EMIHUDRAFT_442900, partial [Emiliania huxleyi CCMP1516]|uniref:Uncharacterized protein n=2 Tax=Emiliania huxleyi TaxID=2903 RepID=A0A0D3JZD1_EMIH1